MNRTKYVISLLLIGMMLLGYVGRVDAGGLLPPSTFIGTIIFASGDPDEPNYLDLDDDYIYAYVPDVVSPFSTLITDNFPADSVMDYRMYVDSDDTTDEEEVIFKIGDRVVAKGKFDRDTTQYLNIHPPFITDTPRPVEVAMSEDGIPTAWSLTLHAADMGDGDVITWSISTAAGHGTAAASGTGTEKSIGYVPTTDYVGSDSFVVKVTDSQGGEDYITVNVTITETTYNLAVSNNGENSGTGTVTSSPAGIDCGSGNTCSYDFNEDTEVTLTAAPAEGSLFMGWGGDCSGTELTCTLTMNEDMEVTATFNAALAIMGYVKEGETGLIKVEMNYGTGLNVFTGDGGSYHITVPYGWSGTVTPSKAGYTFYPISKSYDNYTLALLEENYTATLITYTISGHTGTVEGVTITYDDGTTSNTTKTVSGGSYSFTVPFDWSGTVSASKDGYIFVPTSYTIDEITGNLTRDFTPTQIFQTISGNAGIAYATLTYEGTTSGYEIADETGDYIITVPYGWTGTVTPSHPGYTFDLTHRDYSNVTTSLVDQNYDAMINTYTISGNAGVEGVLITYDGGTTTTNEIGGYSFTVDYGWTGTVTPSLTGYVFDPVNYIITDPIADDLPNQDFTATQIVHSITLSSGWNLVSFNVVPLDKDGDTDVDIEDVLFDIDTFYDKVYAWDATGSSSADGNWLIYYPGSTGNTLTALDAKQGFWIHMTAADKILVVYGSAYATGTEIALHIDAGRWNLVGFPADNNLAMPGALDSYGLKPDTTPLYSLVYGYRATDATDTWELYDPAAPAYVNDLSQLEPGMGYWIRLSDTAVEPVTWKVPY